MLTTLIGCSSPESPPESLSAEPSTSDLAEAADQDPNEFRNAVDQALERLKTDDGSGSDSGRGSDSSREADIGPPPSNPSEALARAETLQNQSGERAAEGDPKQAYDLLNKALDVLNAFPEDFSCRERGIEILAEIERFERRQSQTPSGEPQSSPTDPLIDP